MTIARRDSPYRQADVLQGIPVSAAIAWRDLLVRQAPPAPEPTASLLSPSGCCYAARRCTSILRQY
ncbi:hypothetical protein DEO72_LG10g1019 [Vigna unguiculata]|uniref:Uncharacterized protein n=1 Tax=Vigna unguiculata TaxID=3917 RepID=A0A4D6N7R1_VIGUN|nr:hypothetical protein DEO72_LG10g1019 [Vigna unguiculata]